MTSQLLKVQLLFRKRQTNKKRHFQQNKQKKRKCVDPAWRGRTGPYVCAKAKNLHVELEKLKFLGSQITCRTSKNAAVTEKKTISVCRRNWRKLYHGGMRYTFSKFYACQSCLALFYHIAYYHVLMSHKLQQNLLHSVLAPETLQYGIYREKCVDTNQSKSMKDRLWEVFKFWWIRLRNWELTRKN